MYISKIHIKNFRNFTDKEIQFNDGVNVIIGHNNAGKTNLIKALSLIFDYKFTKRLGSDDFSKSISLESLKKEPPKITISVSISKGETQKDDDLVTISNWLTTLDDSYEALLTYEFFLPEKEKSTYIAAVESILDTDEKALEKIWKIIKHDFIRFYVHKIWGGNIINHAMADAESLQKFDFQFLDAIRDVERDMLTGKNTLLRDVLDFFMDYDIKEKIGKPDDEKNSEIKLKKEKFSNSADSLVSELQERMEVGKKQILSYATATGASFNNAKPDFDGSISEIEMFSALRLIVEYESGIKIPATHNGLGYNNLIFMSLLLAKMQVDSDGDYLGSNAKVFSTLAIEEPEAHLHPAMQYKFLKFIKENKEANKVRQVFISTHSTHITSAVSLGEIICLHNENNETSVSYPAKVFPDTKSKNYVQRFLDATKSDMLFAQKVIFVEGLAEQLLISIFAQYLGQALEDSHIAVISVGGRYFDHFLNLFNSSESEFSMNKKVVCLTDRDPTRKENPKGSKHEKCYPFEYDQNSDEFEYKNNSTDLIEKYRTHPNIRFFSQDNIYGKTLEYDLILHNPSLDLLITDSMRNRSELQEMMVLIESDEPICKILEKLSTDSTKKPHKENNRIKNSINDCDWADEQDKKKAIIAARYLNSVRKGENALELACILEENLTKKGSTDYQEFIVPTYIEDAIKWITQ